jgi:DNA polymerase-1
MLGVHENRQATATKGGRAPEKRRPLLVIDGDSFAHRAYHALPKNILRDGGRPVGAILGFANRLLKLYRTERPRAVLVGWDALEAATYRHDAFADYQSGGEFDDDLVEQLALIPKFVNACGFANARRAGYEADDFLAAAASAEERRSGTALVASGDRDTFQLASARTTILYPVRAGEMARMRGDPSDKLPGAPGVGAQGAAALLRRYGSLDAVLQAGRFARIAEDLRLYRAIATMNKKAPLPSLSNQNPTFAKAATLARSAIGRTAGGDGARSLIARSVATKQSSFELHGLDFLRGACHQVGHFGPVPLARNDRTTMPGGDDGQNFTAPISLPLRQWPRVPWSWRRPRRRWRHRARRARDPFRRIVAQPDLAFGVLPNQRFER